MKAPLTEAQYRSHYLQADIAQMRFALMLLALPNIPFFAIDTFVLPTVDRGWVSMVLRASFLVVSAYVWYALRSELSVRRFDALMCVWSALGLLLLLGNAIVRPATYFGHYLFEIFALLTFFAVVPLAPRLKRLLGVPYVLMALGILFVLKQSNQPLYVMNVAFLLPMTLISGYLIAVRIEKYRRAAVIATQELEAVARTDALTGIANRRAFMHWADIEVSRVGRGSDQGLAVLIIDIDHFKAVNDSFGHSAGDQLLVDFCRRVEANLRHYDAFARMGGEEFVVGLPRCDLAGAIQTAERIRETIGGEPFTVGGAQVTKTVSIGVAVLHPGESEIDAALGRADAALYQAKRSGRNRVLTEADLEGQAMQERT